MKPQVPWLRVLIEGVVVVGSILLAFGIDAWWEGRQDLNRRAVLMDDLRTELVRNAGDLETAVEAQRSRLVRIDVLLSELTPNATGISADSVRALQTSVSLIRTYPPSLGILDLLIQSGDLALLEDRELRARLAGLDALSDHYLGNQTLLVEAYVAPEAIYATGSVFYDYSEVSPSDATLTTASEPVRVTAAKLLVFDRFMTDLMIRQGTVLLEEFHGIVGLMAAP